MTLDALGGLAVPLAYEGKIALALDLLALALHHPAGNTDTRHRANHFLDHLKPDLSPEMVVLAETPITDYAGTLKRLAMAVLAEIDEPAQIREVE